MTFWQLNTRREIVRVDASAKQVMARWRGLHARMYREKRRVDRSAANQWLAGYIAAERRNYETGTFWAT